MTKWLVVLAFLSLDFYVYNYMAKGAVVPARESFTSFPLQIDEWSCDHNEPLPSDIIKNLGATDTLVCNYSRKGGFRPIGLYVGYHATQVREEGGGDAENSIHPPAHCLPGSGWDIIESRTASVDLEGVSDPNAKAKRLIIAKGRERQLVYYWYQMGGRAVAEDWQKILYVGYDRATRGRTDGALVRFTIPFGRYGYRNEEVAEQEFRQFASLVVPMLPRYVPN